MGKIYLGIIFAIEDFHAGSGIAGVIGATFLDLAISSSDFIDQLLGRTPKSVLSKNLTIPRPFFNLPSFASCVVSYISYAVQRISPIGPSNLPAVFIHVPATLPNTLKTPGVPFLTRALNPASAASGAIPLRFLVNISVPLANTSSVAQVFLAFCNKVFVSLYIVDIILSHFF
jgi:hypothetical protein